MTEEEEAREALLTYLVSCGSTWSHQTLTTLVARYLAAIAPKPRFELHRLRDKWYITDMQTGVSLFSSDEALMIQTLKALSAAEEREK